jgi:hypothetical protein
MVAQVILRAATTRPRLRYPVAPDTKMLMLFRRLLPESLFERFRRRAFQVGKTAHLESKTHSVTSD